MWDGRSKYQNEIGLVASLVGKKNQNFWLGNEQILFAYEGITRMGQAFFASKTDDVHAYCENVSAWRIILGKK